MYICERLRLLSIKEKKKLRHRQSTQQKTAIDAEMNHESRLDMKRNKTVSRCVVCMMMEKKKKVIIFLWRN